jgi:hypothetical protein
MALSKSEMQLLKHLIVQVQALNRQVSVYGSEVSLHVVDPVDKTPAPFKVKVTKKELAELGL